VAGTTYQNDAATTSNYDKLFLGLRSGVVSAVIVPESFKNYLDELEITGDTVDLTSDFIQRNGIEFVDENAGERAYLIRF